MGLLASIVARSVSTAIQKLIFQWRIAMFGYSFPKLQTDETYQEMIIAIIDANQLLPGHPDCAKVAKKYPVAFNDLLKMVKNAAGMY